MVIDRRRFIITATSAFAMQALLPGRGWCQSRGEFRTIREGVGIFSERGGTIGWLVRDDAAVVVDSQFQEQAQHCLEGLEERSGRPLDLLLNTHHHGDHTAGNSVFRPKVKHIVAHQKVPELMRRSSRGGSTPAVADVTFSQEWRQDFGGEAVRARHHGPAHTGGDSVIHFEKANVVHMGDLIFNRRHPYIDLPAGASIPGWIRVLDAVLKEFEDDTIFIFGHAGAGHGVTGDQRDVVHQRDYLRASLELVEKGIAAGRKIEEIATVDTLPGFEDYPKGGRRSLRTTLETAYEELTREKRPTSP